MARYRLGTAEHIILQENAGGGPALIVIPTVPENTDYQEYLRWLSKGNTPDPALPTPTKYDGVRGLVGMVLTNDATPTPIFTGTLEQGVGYVADFTIVAVQNGSPYNMLYGRWMQGAKRVSTTAALVGVMADVIPAQGDAAAINLKVSTFVTGAQFGINVIGLAGVQIRWILKGEFFRVSPQGLVD